VIDPSQEMLGIGITNVVGSFFGGFPATGSFSRTAVSSKAGVRTPLGGAFSSIFVIMAVFALPAVFFYIPKATLAAVIIHAIGDLITPPKVIKQFWAISPIEVILFAGSVLVMLFLSIEDGVYAAVLSSILVLLIRLARSKGLMLGLIEVSPMTGPQFSSYRTSVASHISAEPLLGSQTSYEKLHSNTSNRVFPRRSVFMPIDHSDGSNPDVTIRHPYPGVFIFRMTEGFSYPNASVCLTNLMNAVVKYTRQTEMASEQKPGVSFPPMFVLSRLTTVSGSRMERGGEL
jgi:sodium-independent sulfate anion transporter 11